MLNAHFLSENVMLNAHFLSENPFIWEEHYNPSLVAEQEAVSKCDFDTTTRHTLQTSIEGIGYTDCQVLKALGTASLFPIETIAHQYTAKVNVQSPILVQTERIQDTEISGNRNLRQHLSKSAPRRSRPHRYRHTRCSCRSVRDCTHQTR